MQPLSSEIKAQILETRADVTHEDIAEYERLQAARFRRRPPSATTAESALPERVAEDDDSRRLQELHQKLFGPRSQTEQ